MVGVPQPHVEPFVPQGSRCRLPALASCREMLFEVAGAEKRAILTRVLEGENLPAEPHVSTGQTVWLVIDQAAAGEFSWAMRSAEIPCALVVMGVSGSRKSTIAKKPPRQTPRLALRGWRQISPARQCRHQMSAGHPLTGEERGPWLQAITKEIDPSLPSQ